MDLNIFTEAFLARLLPVYSEVTLGAIRHFTLGEYPANAALAAVGGLLALAVYYGVGVWLRRMPERSSTEVQRARIEAMRKAAHEWLPWLLVLSPTPLGGVVVMAAGFFRLRLAMVFLVVIASEILFRAIPYLR
jgi:membrane protein YqaA with SNARE-associated domain